MGLEARCQGRYGHASGEGRLQHEGDKILFRGAFRLDVAVKDLKGVTASADDLVLSWGREKAWFTLGAAVAPIPKRQSGDQGSRSAPGGYGGRFGG